MLNRILPFIIGFVCAVGGTMTLLDVFAITNEWVLGAGFLLLWLFAAFGIRTVESWLDYALSLTRKKK